MLIKNEGVDELEMKKILKKIKLKIKEMIEEDRKRYTNDCFGNRIECISEEEAKRLIEKIENAFKNE